MKKSIDFKEVVNEVRFDMMGQFQMVTPSEFSKMCEDDKIEFYTRLFDLHHDVCEMLSSALSIDKFRIKYEVARGLYDDTEE